MNFTRAILAVLVATSSFAADERPNRFESPTAGFVVEKPAAWRFASIEQVARNRENVRMSDEELQKQVQQLATAPLVIAIKHEEPFDGLNPSFQVILRPRPDSLAEATPKQILELVLPTLQRGFPDFALEQPIREFELSGHRAAESVARYTVRTKEGGVFPTRGRMIIVPRGKFLFLISMSAPPDGEDASNDDFEAILSTVEISE